MLRKALLGMFACALVVSVAAADDKPVSVTVSSVVTSTYMWNGFDRVEDTFGSDNTGPAVQPKVTVGVKNTGLSASVGGSFVVNEDSQLHETTYGVNVVRDVSPVVSVGAGYTYFDNRAKVAGVEVVDGDVHEVWGGVELNSSVGVKPGVAVKYEKSTTEGVDGFAVVAGTLKYGMPLTGVTLGGAAVDVNWKTGVLYNTGVKVNDVEVVKSGVSAWQLGVSSDIKTGSVVVSPSVNYQVSVEDTVNPDNEFWATVGVSFGF
jgi:hypothetical protein